MKKHFVIKLVSEKPMNLSALTEFEQKVMGEHVQYWKVMMGKGYVLAIGPVLDPAGVYGLGIIAADNREQVDELLKNDPALQLGKYEVAEMLAMVP